MDDEARILREYSHQGRVFSVEPFVILVGPIGKEDEWAAA